MTLPSAPRVGGPVLPVLIAVLDGVGIGRADAADAVAAARTPTLHRLGTLGPVTELCAHGTSVGLPSDEDMGNSEVGHNALGAGRVFAQGATLVAEAIGSLQIFEGATWRALIAHLGATRGALHFIGLLSDGNVHSHLDHLVALLRHAASAGVARAFVHALLDGRDVPRASAEQYLARLDSVLGEVQERYGVFYRVASGGGRMTTTMDRYGADWAMVERGWRAHVFGDAVQFPSALAAVQRFRAEHPGIGDQDLPAFVVTGDGQVTKIVDGDAVVAFNFRGDRMIELCHAFEDERFEKFDRVRKPDVFFAGMTLYDGDTQTPRKYLVNPPHIDQPMSELLCARGLSQLAVAETQKYGHVTYFWNGNRSGMFDAARERYVEVPSRPPPFDAWPEMRAAEVAVAVLEEMGKRRFDCVRVNFANGDMVGHTGNFAATVRAVEAADAALGALVEAFVRANGAVIVTADHGNAEDMAERDEQGHILRMHGQMVPKTSHSKNPVVCGFALPETLRGRLRLADVGHPPAGLGHVAASALTLLGVPVPAAYLPSLVEWI